MKSFIKSIVALLIIAVIVAGILVEKTIPTSFAEEKIKNIAKIEVIKESDFTKDGLKNLPNKIVYKNATVTKTNALGAESTKTEVNEITITAKVTDKNAEFNVAILDGGEEHGGTYYTDYEKFYSQEKDKDAEELEEEDFYNNLEFIYAFALDLDWDSDKKVYNLPEVSVFEDGEITRVSSKALSLIGYAETQSKKVEYTRSLFGDKVSAYKVVKSSNLGEYISSVTTTEVNITYPNLVTKLLIK